MKDLNRYIGPVILMWLVFFFLLPKAQRALTHPANPSRTTPHRDVGHIAPAVPLLLPVRSQRTVYDHHACRLACEQFGFWEMEQVRTDRLVNACKIGCNLGQDHCL